MSLAFYMDVHVPRSITRSLIDAGFNVLTAQDDGCSRMSDPDLLDRASALGRILFTRDEDLLAEASRRQQADLPFCGVIYAHQLRVTIGQCVRDLQLLAECASASDMANHLEHLPLR